MKQQFIAASLLICSLSQVQDPQTGKIGWLEACGEVGKPKHYLGHFDKDQKHAMKRAKQFFKAWRPEVNPQGKYTVSLGQLRAGK